MMQDRELYSIVEILLSKMPNNIGLLNGEFSQVFFLYYSSLYNSDIEKSADKAFDSWLLKLSKCTHFSYCNGFAGIGVAMHLLEEKGRLEGSNDFLSGLDSYFSMCLDELINARNYDFLHGIIGIGFYYLSHYKFDKWISRKQLWKIWCFLKYTAIVDNSLQTAKWVELNRYHDKNWTSETRYNLSLSHGQSSIILFLVKLLSLSPFEENKNESVKALLRQAVNYLLRQRIDFDQYGSCFPSISLECIRTITPSRLAWCYGDLGIAIALYRSGKILNDVELQQEALKVLELNALRRSSEQTHVVDRFICHGTSGIAQIYYRMYLETGNMLFKDTYLYWKEATLTWDFTDKNGTFSILEGLSGVGLMLLSEYDSDWDSLLLLH